VWYEREGLVDGVLLVVVGVDSGFVWVGGLVDWEGGGGIGGLSEEGCEA